MALFIVFYFVLSFCIVHGTVLRTAGPLTSPPQWLWYYFAYKVEFLAFPPAQRKMAQGCVGASGGPCTMDEFLIATMPTKDKLGYTSRRGVFYAPYLTGHPEMATTNPTVDTIEYAIKHANFHNVLDHEKVHSGVAKGGGTASDTIHIITDTLQEARRAAESSNTLHKAMIQANIDEANKAMLLQIGARYKDQGTNIFNDFDSYYAGTEVQIKGTPESLAGYNWLQIDLEKSITASTTLATTQSQLDTINDFERQFRSWLNPPLGLDDPSLSINQKAAITHNLMIAACETSYLRTVGPCEA